MSVLIVPHSVIGYSDLFFRLPYEDVNHIKVVQQKDGDLSLVCSCRWWVLRWTKTVPNWTVKDVQRLAQGLTLTAIVVEW